MFKDTKLKDLYSQKLDPAWDHKIINYDTNKYNWNEQFLTLAQELKPDIKNLQDLHLHFKVNELVELRKLYEKYTNSVSFGNLLDEFVWDNLRDKIPTEDYLIQRTTGIRLLIPNQAKAGRLLSFHTGYWTGYDNFMYTAWTPVTDARDSNSMQVIDWNNTISIMEQIHKDKLGLSEIQDICEKVCYPVNINFGQSWLFNQGHLHGNINNDTGVSRVSFDVRIATPDSDYEYRRPGSFYRFPGDSTESSLGRVKKNGRWIVYVEPTSAKNIPHYMIREFLLQYSRNLNLNIIEWINGYFFVPWMPVLKNRIEAHLVDGIVMASIFSHTLSNDEFLELLETAVNKGIQIIFADENLVIENLKDVDSVRKLYRFRK